MTLRTREEESRREVVTAVMQRKRLVRVGVGSGAAVLLVIVIGLARTAWQEAASQWKAGDRLVLQVAAKQKAAAKKSVEGQEPLTLKGHSNTVTSVSFSPDGKRIVSGGGGYGKPGDGTVKVWDAQTGQETLTLKGHSGRVMSVSFSPDGNQIVSGSWDHTLKVWDISSLDTSK